MSPEFLRGAYTVFLLEGIIYTVVWLVQRYRALPYLECEKCPDCSSPLDFGGRGLGSIEKLRVCTRCGDTWPEKFDRGKGPSVSSAEWAKEARDGRFQKVHDAQEGRAGRGQAHRL